MADVVIKLLPKQWQFYKSTAREVIYAGGYGSGKTIAVCVKIICHAMIPGNLVLLTRKTRSSLVSTTLRTLLIGDGKMPAILPPGSYEHNESRSIIRLYGGGEIIYRGCDDDYAIRSLNLGAVGVDEAVELVAEEWDALASRIRLPVDPHRQLFGATNPGSTGHFLYRRWMDNKSTVDLITTAIDDNPYLPADYVADQKGRYTGANFRRYVMGEWCSNAGVVYPEWDYDKHIKINPAIYRYNIAACDIGYNDPTDMLIAGYDDQHIHIRREIRSPALSPTDIVDALKAECDISPGMRVVIDKSASGVIRQAESAGLSVVKSNSDINGGIARVKEMLRNGTLTVDPSCIALITEIDSYCWKDGGDKPVDTENHAMDALRYLVNFYYDKMAERIAPSVMLLGGEGKRLLGGEISAYDRWLQNDD